MRFYTQKHLYYCGIDLHARSMYLCILDHDDGQVVFHRSVRAEPEPFLKAIAAYRKDIVVAVECIFTWYWLADLCAQEGIPFVLGHALYMKAIHGGKAKNDKIDARKIAGLLRSGMIPQAYVYPARMRPTRDLLRRRTFMVRKKAELLSHIQNTNSQYNLPAFKRNLASKCHRVGVAEHFPNPTVRKSIQANLVLIEVYGKLIRELELYIVRTAKEHDPQAFHLLQTVPGIGTTLALVILYEIHDIRRFPTVQDFASYSRLVKCAKMSAGKKHGYSGNKIGNANLKWAFSEAAALFLGGNPRGQKLKARLESKHGKGKAMSILAHKLGRAVYYMLRRNQAFDVDKFFGC